MKRHPRIRKTVKWTSAAMVVVLAVVWLCSLPRIIVFASASRWFELQALGVRSFPVRDENGNAISIGWWFGPFFQPRDLFAISDLWPQYDEFRQTVYIPFWIPLVVCGVTWLVLWRRDRRLTRVEQGRCVKCGYNRAGLKDASAACPECGTAPPPPADAKA